MKPITENQRRILAMWVRHSQEGETTYPGTFDLGLTSGPAGSMWPSLKKRGMVENVTITTKEACECCGRGPNTVTRGRVTEAGLEALTASA